MRCNFFVLVTLISIAASCVMPSNSYNPSPTPPSHGCFPVGYDPLSRGRPFEDTPISQPPLRKDVLKAKRWQPPEGYRPRRTDKRGKEATVWMGWLWASTRIGKTPQAELKRRSD